MRLRSPRSPHVRDSQRRRVYAAEGAFRQDFGAGAALPEVRDVERFVARVFSAKRVLKRWPWMQGHTIEVYHGAGCKNAIAYNAYKISIPLWARTEFPVLHELAHIIHYAGGRSQWQVPRKVRDHGAAMPSHQDDPLWHQAHGYAFCRIFLDLVLLYMGRTAMEHLRAKFKAGRVRYKAKRQMSPEQRAAAVERLAKLRPKAEYFRREGLARAGFAVSQ